MRKTSRIRIIVVVALLGGVGIGTAAGPPHSSEIVNDQSKPVTLSSTSNYRLRKDDATATLVSTAKLAITADAINYCHWKGHEVTFSYWLRYSNGRKITHVSTWIFHPAILYFAEAPGTKLKLATPMGCAPGGVYTFAPT